MRGAWAQGPVQDALVEVAGLSVCDAAGRAVLEDVCLRLEAGGTLAVVGESGAGKTTLALALFGRVRRGLRVCAGGVRVAGRDVLALRGRDLRAFRRTCLSGLSQDPALSLTPTMDVWDLLRETGCASRQEALDLLAAVGLGELGRVLDRRPGELSGGQRRRVALARAMASRPALLVLDEPTSGVDPQAAREVIEAVRAVSAQTGCAVLAITHDLGVARQLGGRVAVMDRGRVVEQGSCALLDAPASAYARRLVEAEALAGLGQAGEWGAGAGGVRVRGGAAGEPGAGTGVAGEPGTTGDVRVRDTAGEPGAAGPGAGLPAAPVVLRVRGLCVDTPDGRPAVRDLTFDVRAGEGVALTGASGAGKSTVVRVLTGQRPARAGTIELVVGAGEARGTGEKAAGGGCAASTLERLAPTYAGRTRDQLLALQVVPQDPATSLNPALRIGRQLARACARRHPAWSRDRRDVRVAELMAMVGLDEGLLSCVPHEVSGGQAQRVAIARALAHEPRVLICDESTAALDATTQQGVLEMLLRLRETTGVALVMVTHAPQVARAMCARAYPVGVVGEAAPAPTRT